MTLHGDCLVEMRGLTSEGKVWYTGSEMNNKTLRANNFTTPVRGSIVSVCGFRRGVHPKCNLWPVSFEGV